MIELDGGQHFRDVAGWDTSVVDVRRRDTYKAHALLTQVEEPGIRGLVRVRQIDVVNDAWAKWKERLGAAIEEVAALAKPDVRYVSARADAYDAHKAELADAVAADTAPSYASASASDVSGRKRKRDDNVAEPEPDAKRGCIDEFA